MGGPPRSTIPPVTPSSDTSMGNEVTQILQLLKAEFEEGRAFGTVEIITLDAGAVFQRLYANVKNVKRALIQNISVEDVTITTAINATQGEGIILNAALALGTAGGSLPVSNIDLSTLCFVRTTAGITLSIYLER